jgi:hypothetical protein
MKQSSQPYLGIICWHPAGFGALSPVRDRFFFAANFIPRASLSCPVFQVPLSRRNGSSRGTLKLH